MNEVYCCPGDEPGTSPSRSREGYLPVPRFLFRTAETAETGGVDVQGPGAQPEISVGLQTKAELRREEVQPSPGAAHLGRAVGQQRKRIQPSAERVHLELDLAGEYNPLRASSCRNSESVVLGANTHDRHQQVRQAVQAFQDLALLVVARTIAAIGEYHELAMQQKRCRRASTAKASSRAPWKSVEVSGARRRASSCAPRILRSSRALSMVKLPSGWICRAKAKRAQLLSSRMLVDEALQELAKIVSAAATAATYDRGADVEQDQSTKSYRWAERSHLDERLVSGEAASVLVQREVALS